MNTGNASTVQASGIYQKCTFVLETPEGAYLLPYPEFPGEHGEVVALQAQFGGLVLPSFCIPVHCLLPIISNSIVPCN